MTEIKLMDHDDLCFIPKRDYGSVSAFLSQSGVSARYMDEYDIFREFPDRVINMSCTMHGVTWTDPDRLVGVYSPVEPRCLAKIAEELDLSGDEYE